MKLLLVTSFAVLVYLNSIVTQESTTNSSQTLQPITQTEQISTNSTEVPTTNNPSNSTEESPCDKIGQFCLLNTNCCENERCIFFRCSKQESCSELFCEKDSDCCDGFKCTPLIRRFGSFLDFIPMSNIQRTCVKKNN